jgi:lipoate-protein ligase A
LESYNRLAQALLYAVRELGLPVEIKEYESSGHAAGAENPVCFEVPATYEITINGKKLIGSAQARRKEGVLQHGSLPLTGDLTRICQVLVFKDEAARENAAQRLLTRATTVSTVLNTGVQSVIGVEKDWETAAQAFVHGFETQLGIRFERGELSRSESERAEELVIEKYAHPSWTEKS